MSSMEPEKPVGKGQEAQPAGREPEASAASQRYRTKFVPELEWREVVPGSRPGERVLRVVRPNVRNFKRVGVRHLVATTKVIEPTRGTIGILQRLRRALIGFPLASAELPHERVSKFKGLALFASDALSSSAYSVEEVLLILVLAGTVALNFALPVAIAIAILIAIVVTSYRQTIRAYPHGGGTYIVTRDNFGSIPALIAAAALLIDYTLTVAVSISSGVAQITSAFPALTPLRVNLAVAFILIIMLVNLRGIRESATIFALPTYIFIFAMFTTLGFGMVKWFTGTLETQPAPAPAVPVTESVTLFLLLRAFAGGCSALTGTEAIADGAGAFKEPTWKNAGRTLIAMGAILATMVVGLAFLSQQLDIVPLEHETVVSQVTRAVFGTGLPYFFVQFTTMLILILAANTAFADFPRLSYFLARDKYMPHQFQFRGERLAFSTGIVVLAALALGLVLIFSADTHALIPLYAVGVFLAFTFSQSSMVKHWLNNRGSGWRRSAVINAVGALTTGIVAIVIASTKFILGAWMVIVLIPVFVFILNAIHSHYEFVRQKLKLQPGEKLPQPREQPVIVPVAGFHRGVAYALAYAKSISSNVAAVFVTDAPEEAKRVTADWERYECDVPLVILESPYRALVGPLLAYIDAIDQQDPEAPITVVLPEFIPRHWWDGILHNQDALRLKLALFFRPNTVVVDVPFHLGQATK